MGAACTPAPRRASARTAARGRRRCSVSATSTSGPGWQRHAARAARRARVGQRGREHRYRGHRGEHARHGVQPHAAPAVEHVVSAGRGVAGPPPPGRARHHAAADHRPLQSYGNASVFISGPLRDRLGLVFAGSYSRRDASRTRQPGRARQRTRIGVYAPGLHRSPQDEVRACFGSSASTTPVEHPLIFPEPDAQVSTTSFSLQTTWERRGTAGHHPGARSRRCRRAIARRAPGAQERPVDRAPG